ncbi:MAG: hypothetical protein LBM98_12250 [Oscillospiraceae bacterium]|nr:hypothetical protein [Oscillospiraceae bacterium]
MRYVGRYRCEAIQCRERNIRYVSQDCTSTLDCFAAYHYIRIASAAAASQRRAGRKPCPVPAHCAGTVDGVTSAHGAGNHPAASRHPSQEGNLRGWAGLKPAPT